MALVLVRFPCECFDWAFAATPDYLAELFAQATAGTAEPFIVERDGVAVLRHRAFKRVDMG